MNTKDVYVLTQEIADMVKGSLDNWENDDIRTLAKLYAGTEDRETLIRKIATDYVSYVLSEGEELLDAFLFIELDTRGTLLTRDHFVTEEEAEKNGYYWHETFNRWMPQS